MRPERLDNIYIATFSGNAEETALKYGYGLELNDLCISLNLEEDRRETAVERMIGRLEKAGCLERPKDDIGEMRLLRRTFMHGPFTELTPAAIDPRAIDLMIDRYKSSIEICERLGIRDMVLHDGYIPLIYQKPWHLKRSIAFWKDFAPEIPEGFRVYIENVFDDEPGLLSDILDGVGDDKYRICLDIGHANAIFGTGAGGGAAADGAAAGGTAAATENVVSWIRTLGSRIGHFHLHNNDGSGDNHDDIDRGSLDAEKVLEAIEEFCSPEVTMTIESRDAGPSAEYLFRYYGE